MSWEKEMEMLGKGVLEEVCEVGTVRGKQGMTLDQ